MCEWVWVVYDPPPNTHTHTHNKAKKRKNSTLECKENYKMLGISDVKKVNKRKNCLTPANLESKKKDKKVLVSRVEQGWDVSNES